MLHWPKKSLVMPFYYINFDQNGPPYDSANSKAKEEHVQYGCLKRTWNFLRIGENFHETFRLFTPLLKNSE